MVQAVRRARPRSSSSSARSTPAGSRSSSVDVDANPGVASRYGVLTLPTAILFEGGEPRAEVLGARSQAHYERAWAPWLEPDGLAEVLQPASATGRPARRSSTPSPASQRPTTVELAGVLDRGEQLVVLAEADRARTGRARAARRAPATPSASGTRSSSITQRTPERSARWPASAASPSERSSMRVRVRGERAALVEPQRRPQVRCDERALDPVLEAEKPAAGRRAGR